MSYTTWQLFDRSSSFDAKHFVNHTLVPDYHIYVSRQPSSFLRDWISSFWCVDRRNGWSNWELQIQDQVVTSDLVATALLTSFLPHRTRRNHWSASVHEHLQCSSTGMKGITSNPSPALLCGFEIERKKIIRQLWTAYSYWHFVVSYCIGDRFLSAAVSNSESPASIVPREGHS